MDLRERRQIRGLEHRQPLRAGDRQTAADEFQSIAPIPDGAVEYLGLVHHQPRQRIERRRDHLAQAGKDICRLVQAPRVAEPREEARPEPPARAAVGRLKNQASRGPRLDVGKSDAGDGTGHDRARQGGRFDVVRGSYRAGGEDSIETVAPGVDAPEVLALDGHELDRPRDGQVQPRHIATRLEGGERLLELRAAGGRIVHDVRRGLPVAQPRLRGQGLRAQLLDPGGERSEAPFGDQPGRVSEHQRHRLVFGARAREQLDGLVENAPGGAGAGGAGEQLGARLRAREQERAQERVVPVGRLLGRQALEQQTAAVQIRQQSAGRL